MDKEQAEEILKKYLKHIKNAIKNRINIYDPLDFKTAFEAFLQWAKKEEYKVIREFPGEPDFETYLNDLIRQFLVEKAYFSLLFEDQDLVENYVRKILTNYSIPLNLDWEIAVFVRERLETQKKVAAVKRGFKEGSKFKTYFYTICINLVRDYQKKNYPQDGDKVIKKVEPNEGNNIDKFPSDSPTPLTAAEISEIKERVDKLPDKEKLAIKLYYYDGITNFNMIGRSLKTSRYKAKKIFKSAENKILKGKLKYKKREKKNDTPGD